VFLRWEEGVGLLVDWVDSFFSPGGGFVGYDYLDVAHSQVNGSGPYVFGGSVWLVIEHYIHSPRGHYHRIYESTDAGVSWTNAGELLISNTNRAAPLPVFKGGNIHIFYWLAGSGDKDLHHKIFSCTTRTFSDASTLTLPTFFDPNFQFVSGVYLDSSDRPIVNRIGGEEYHNSNYIPWLGRWNGSAWENDVLLYPSFVGMPVRGFNLSWFPNPVGLLASDGKLHFIYCASNEDEVDVGYSSFVTRYVRYDPDTGVVDRLTELSIPAGGPLLIPVEGPHGWVASLFSNGVELGNDLFFGLLCLSYNVNDNYVYAAKIKDFATAPVITMTLLSDVPDLSNDLCAFLDGTRVVIVWTGASSATGIVPNTVRVSVSDDAGATWSTETLWDLLTGDARFQGDTAEEYISAGVIE